MRVHVEHNVRLYLPRVDWYWSDQDRGFAALTVGNRACDPMFGVSVELRPPAWLARLLPS